MNKRDLVLSALNHEENIVPLWTMGFENLSTAKRLIGDTSDVTSFPFTNIKCLLVFIQ